MTYLIRSKWSLIFQEEKFVRTFQEEDVFSNFSFEMEYRTRYFHRVRYVHGRESDILFSLYSGVESTNLKSLILPCVEANT